MKIKKFNESVGEDEIKSLFSYAKDLASGFDTEMIDDEGENYCIVYLEHSFYDMSSYSDFSSFAKIIAELDDVCNKLKNVYNLSFSFEERSSSIITVVIRLK